MKVTTTRYLVLGAGPAGLQVAYYLQQSGYDYLVLERGETVGNTFKQFPRHRTLISINKRFTGSDHVGFNLRHDWNSLLCKDQEISFTTYDESFFPHADRLVDYFADYSNKYALNVRLETNVVSVSRQADGKYCLADEEGNQYIAEILIVATGLQRTFMPEIPGIELADTYAEMSLDRKKFENKRVLIIGKGNSGFETADHLVNSASLIHIASPNPIMMAWKTHYVGNLRAVNNNFLDTYQLKSQNAVLDVDVLSISKMPDGKLAVVMKYRHAEDEVETICYDSVLLCAGFRFSAIPFDESCKPETTYSGKYPKIGSDFQSCNLPNMYFAGTLTHSLDFKKATSGFIHGFRYNARALFHILNNRFEGVDFPETELEKSIDDVSGAMLYRMNYADGIWQQPGFLADAFVLSKNTVLHFQEFPLGYYADRFSDREYFTLSMEYGAPIKGDPFNVERIHRANIENAERSQFLHPVIRHFKNGTMIAKHDVIEDLEAHWVDEEHIAPLRKFLSMEGLNSAMSSGRSVVGQEEPVAEVEDAYHGA